MLKYCGPAALCVALATAAIAEPLPMDRAVHLDSLETVCTGIGEAKDDPQWKAYPIRIEFSNGGAQYLAGAMVRVRKDRTMIAEMDCPGAWVLLRGPLGNYQVSATIDGSQSKPATARFTMGGGAQKRVVLRFPEFRANN